jgi:hypothetical protein
MKMDIFGKNLSKTRAMSFSSISFAIERTRRNMTRIAELRAMHNGSQVHTDDPVTYVANTNESPAIAVHSIVPAGRSAINGNVTWGNGSWNEERLVRRSVEEEEEEEELADQFRNMPGFGIPLPMRTPELSPVVLIERIWPCSADGVRASRYIDRPVRAIEMGEPESCLPNFLMLYQRDVVCSLKIRWLAITELWGKFLTRVQLNIIRRALARIAHKIFRHASSIRELDAFPALHARSQRKFRKMMKRLVYPMLGGERYTLQEAFNVEFNTQAACARRGDLLN